MTFVASGVVGPPGSAKKILLSGESHEIKIISAKRESGNDDEIINIPFPAYECLKNQEMIEKYVQAITGKSTAGKVMTFTKGDKFIECLIKGPQITSDSFNVITQYPDGYIHHHQAKDVMGLLSQVSQKLKTRYNLKSFAFSRAPDELAVGQTIITGDNIHDPELHHDGA